MRIGIVCEGYTDFLTIKYFVENDLKKINFDISFHLIQPSSDETLPGGWSQVLYWLEKNRPSYRSSVYLKGQNLFSTDNEENKYDALIFQIDSDIIGNEGFEKFISKRGVPCLNPSCPETRSEYIEEVIGTISENPGSLKEICLAIVESCETWAIAAAGNNPNSECMSESEVLSAFDNIIHNYTSLRKHHKCNVIDKNKELREELYEKMVSNGMSPIGNAKQYDKLLYKIENINGNKILFSICN